ncbi:TerB N-terminal domain-containing protein [Breoghania sp. L-A4]|uniref:tellurite resistance TerB family protein n=1 Tax=Breoghania sp. L-A4 TaxID=2304600 RepID=UPI0013C2E16D|nr:TerB N-terminal domain-containing protein [Breoghania sp. L-A4]
MAFILIRFGIFGMIYFFGRRKRAEDTASSTEPDQHPVPQERWRGEPTSARQEAGRAVARWIVPGQLVVIAGIRITDGNFYLGSLLGAPDHSGPDKALVNPHLTVGNDTDHSGDTMPYWPSYSEVHPNARRSYLTWLASDRDDPATYIGYVFLYFYGLERRFFLDDAPSDNALLIAEVRRLLLIYGENDSFNRYATQFLEFAHSITGTLDTRPDIDARPRSGYGYEFPLPARLYLGTRLDNGHTFDADDCLLWLVSSPDTRLRTPAKRCFDLFRPLWRIRFRERHPDGLAVRTPKRTLKNIGYRAASGTFTANLTGAEALPDIAALTGPLKGLKAIAETCTSELESYSRFIGKRPGAAYETEAAVLLPNALLKAEDHNPLKALAGKLTDELGYRKTGRLALARLCETIGLDAPPEGKVPAAHLNRLGAALDRLDIGFEPDRRYGAISPPADGTIVFFRASSAGAVDSGSAPFRAARTVVEINALAALADGTVDASEVAALQEEIRAIPDLGAMERVRLLAYASALLAGTANSRALMKGIGNLSDADRHRVAQAAVAVVLADGHVSRSEVVFIEKLWKSLGLPRDELYSALHSGTVTADEPVTVLPETSERGHTIPRPRTAEKPGVEIDRARLARIVSETSAVSSLLANIFVEDDRPAARSRSRANVGPSPFNGLDSEHGNLLLFLLNEERVDRSAFEFRAKQLRVLPDGAIETINEWGFEIYDEPILEDEDELAVIAHLRPLLEDVCREKREMEL